LKSVLAATIDTMRLIVLLCVIGQAVVFLTDGLSLPPSGRAGLGCRMRDSRRRRPHLRIAAERGDSDADDASPIDCDTADDCDALAASSRAEVERLRREADALRRDAEQQEAELAAARRSTAPDDTAQPPAAAPRPDAAPEVAPRATATATPRVADGGAGTAETVAVPALAARWSLRLNFGREANTWMPPEYGASGARLALLAPVEFLAAP